MLHHQTAINKLLIAMKTATQISNIYQLTVLNDVASNLNVFEPDSDRMTKHNLKTSNRF